MKSLPGLSLLLLSTVLAASAAAQPVVTLREMIGERGLVIQGKGGVNLAACESIVGELGASVAYVDANGDGFDDLLVGAARLPNNPAAGVQDDAGHAFLIFGAPGQGEIGTDPSADVLLKVLDASVAIDFRGPAPASGMPGAQVGTSVANAGDVNDDGFDDFLIGAPFRTQDGLTAAGGAYLVFGDPNLDQLGATVSLRNLTLDPVDRAVFLRGARAFGTTGQSVSGGGDVNADGVPDIVLGSPLDSTTPPGTSTALTNNGTATIVYGSRTLFDGVSTIDLGALGAGEATVVHGNESFQLLGTSVAIVGQFDPVLPLNGVMQNDALGEDVAIGAPGASPNGRPFAGAVYVMRGSVGIVPPVEYSVAQFGNGPNKAGIVYAGAAPGDGAGSWVAPAGDFIPEPFGPPGLFDDLLIAAPTSDALGRPNAGMVYAMSGEFLGVPPQGGDLGLVGPANPFVRGIQIAGALTGDGNAGVFACSAGDWNDDGFVDLLLGYPAAPRIDGANVFTLAGRSRLVDGETALLEQGTVDLAVISGKFDLMLFEGEATGALAGAVASGDMNGDGDPDVAIGAAGAPSDIDPLDPSCLPTTCGNCLGFAATGRVHTVFGPVTRILGIAPTQSHFGGPPVTIDALDLVEGGLEVEVDGVDAEILDVVEGAVGSVTFAPPPPLVPGNAATVMLNGVELDEPLLYNELEVTSGPSPSAGVGGSVVNFFGNGFSTVEDTSVLFDGVPGTVLSVDGVAGTMSVELPRLTVGSVADVDILNSNGNVILTDAVTFQTFFVQSITPEAVTQMVGIFDDSVAPAFEGFPPQTATVTVVTDGSPLDPATTLELGNAEIGFMEIEDVTLNGFDLEFDLPDLLLGPEDVPIDVRVTSGADVDTLVGGILYEACDFVTGGLGTAGFGEGPPRLRLAGSATNGGDLLVLNTNWPDQTEFHFMFFGLDVLEPPAMVKGGEFGIGGPVLFTFATAASAPGLTISTKMPNNISPLSNGVSIYFQAINQEFDDVLDKKDFAFSNVMEMILNVPAEE